MPIWLCYCSLLLQMIAQIKKAKDSVRENTSDIAFDITDVTVKLSDTSTLKALHKGSDLHLHFHLQIYFFFTHLKLWVATARHNFKWEKNTFICLIWDQIFANLNA